MKKTSLAALIALTASVTADDMGSNSKKNMTIDSGMMNTSARPLDGTSWDVFADALIWKANLGGSEWARAPDVTSTQTGLSTNSNVYTTRIKNGSFDWRWGFRAGIGYNMNHDEWDTQLYYSWFQTNRTQNVGISTTTQAANTVSGTAGNQSGSQVSSALSRNDLSFITGTNHWGIKFSMFDWELARNYFVSKHLSLRPHAGVKGGWIHQLMHGTFSTAGVGAAATNQNYKGRNNFKGIGPSVGVNGMWFLGNLGPHRFSILGDVAGALMWSHFSVSQQHYDNTYGIYKYRGLNKNTASTMLQTMLGLAWDTNFYGDRFHFALKVGYELQYWFDQNQFVTPAGYSNATGSPGRKVGDLAMQGGTIRLCFDF